MQDFQKKLFQDSNIKQDVIPVVVSSRIRFARNIANFNFVKYSCRTDLHTVADKCENALKSYSEIKDNVIFNMSELEDYEKSALVEQHLCSPEFVVNSNESRLIFSCDHQTSIMINEEDHLRMQVFCNDLNFKSLFEKLNQIDDHLSENLEVAFDSRYGFLTSCPMNVGTGMRASVMLHLPALVVMKQLNNLILAVQKLGFVVRGMFGEGTEAQGNFFQISNQQTLGLTEVDILSRLSQIIKSIIDYENNAREILKKERLVWLYDNIGRALGILRECYCISSNDAINYLSLIMLACDLGYLPNNLRYDLNQVMMKIQNAHLQVLANKLLKLPELEIKRASILREFFDRVPKLQF